MKQTVESVNWRTREKKTPRNTKKRKRGSERTEMVRELQHNIKHNNIHSIGIPEGEEEEQGTENLFAKVMMENFPNLMREKVTQIQETQRGSQSRGTQRGPPQDTS